MKFFAQAFNASPPTWKEQAGCLAAALLPFLCILAFLFSLVYLGYWLGAQ